MKLSNNIKKSLYTLYIVEKISTRKIAKLFNVHNSTISRTLKRMKIKTKYRLNLNNKKIIHLYLINKKSLEQIAKKYHCSRCVIHRILKFNKIKIRPKEFYSQKEYNGRWLGGLSFLEYSKRWTYELKESIRKRDNYKCQKCKKYGKHVHHIDYNKENCRKVNLITLCIKCHIATNSNRDYWYAYFIYKIGDNK